MPREAVVIVLAGGVGSRFGRPTPKQFVRIAGRQLLAWTLASLPLDYDVVVVYNREHIGATRAIVAQVGRSIRLVAGGSTRRESISCGLAAIGDLDAGVPVVIQNGASPNTPVGLIRQCVAEAYQHDVVQAFMPATHTVFEYEGSELIRVLPRHSLGYTTDPTVYRLASLRKIVDVHRDEVGEMTLDTARALGMSIHLVPSPPSNIKLTTAADIPSLEAYLTGR